MRLMIYRKVLTRGNMRKILFILFLFFPLALWGQNYFVAAPPLGSDATGDGSPETPWATLSHACSQVTTVGHVINLMTDITDNNRAVLRLGVNLTGIGLKKVTTNFATTSASNAYVYAYSSSTTNGATSTISYIHFDGNNLTANRAIWIGYRGNVKIHHCVFEDFYDCGVHFRNEAGWTTPPSVYATGNEVHDCSFINCSAMHGNQPAELRLDGQSGMLIYNNVFDQRDRPLGQNGANVRWSNVQKIKMYNNTFYKNPVEVVADGTYDWPFFCELWMTKGNCEIYSNIFYGQHTIDIAGFQNDIISGNSFSIKVYDNQFLNSSKVDPVLLSPSNYSHQYAITVEGTDWEYVYIYNNHIQRYGYGIEIATSYATPSGIPELNYLHDHFYIYNNIFEDMGYATYTYSAAIVLINEVNDPGYGNTTSNWWIVNNVMRGGNRCYNGIRFTIIDEGTNIFIKNNIIDDFTNYAVYITKRTTDVTYLTNFEVTYNDFYSNGTNGTYINPGIFQSNVNTSTGNIIQDPLFTSSTNFHLQANSPCIMVGTNISWLTKDYDGNDYMYPNPSMGVYEIAGDNLPVLTTTAISSVTSTTAVSGGNITSDGGSAVTARGVCYSMSTSPTISGDKTVNGTGTGSYTSNIAHLSPATTYYVRAYATNSAGTAYGNERSFMTKPAVVSVSITKLFDQFFVINNSLTKITVE